MISPYLIPPHPLAQAAAEELLRTMQAYMNAHPESELHRQGKMFGVLVCEDGRTLAAFSAMLDGQTVMEGFVPPIYTGATMPVGHSRAESQRLQRLFFADQLVVNTDGQTRSLLDIFRHEQPILSPEEWFRRTDRSEAKSDKLPPSGAGECCAPKLLQYALTHGMKPFALAEFWVGAPPANELRREGCFYPPCSGRCKPILRWMIGDDGEQPETGGPIPDPEVLYEDEWLMVVNKPAGLLSVPGKGDEPSVEQRMHAKAVHRLDRDTSGLLVLAKTPEVYKTLQAYFQRRDIRKRYEALLCPLDETSRLRLMEGNEGMIDLPLLPNPYDRPRQMVDREHGKPALTTYHVRERRSDGVLFVDFYPLTGRTHQLRVHAAHPDGLNAPILGDRLYGQQITNRMFLHSAEITFIHPVTQKEMHFCIPSAFAIEHV